MARPRRRKSIASKVGETVADPVSLYSSFGILPPEDNGNAVRVTVSVHPGLIRYIDDYVEQHPETNRSAVFEQAIELWIHWMQSETYKRYYSSHKETQEEADWRAIQTEAAKFIWP